MDNFDSKEWTVSSVLDWTSDYFNRSKVNEARLESEILLAKVMNCNRLALNLQKDKILSAKHLSSYKAYILQRKTRKPIAYILGEQEFMGLNFLVDTSTLIPRPETEILVEEAMNRVKGKKLMIEVGTGSGNISVSIAKLSQLPKIYATDISLDALKVAQENVFRHGVAAKIVLKHGDLFKAIEGDGLAGKADIIVSNPPYIARNEFASLEPELKFEPQHALDGGEDGLDFYRSLAKDSKKYLKPGGFISVEMNSGKSMNIRDIFETTGYAIEAMIKDYAGLDRVLTARLAN